MCQPTQEAHACARAWLRTMTSFKVVVNHVIEVFVQDVTRAIITSMFKINTHGVPFDIQDYVSDDSNVLAIGNSYLTVENMVKLQMIDNATYEFSMVEM